jgi:hypothetical protein
MLSRRNWVTDFIGYVLRRGLSDDPDWVFDTASSNSVSRMRARPSPHVTSAKVQERLVHETEAMLRSLAHDQ